MPLPSFDSIAHEPHYVAMTMVSSSGAIFCTSAAKLTGHDHHIIGLTEDGPQLQQGGGQVGQIVPQLTRDAALIDVGILPTG